MWSQGEAEGEGVTVASIRPEYDTLRVCTACLGEMLQEWIDRFDRIHPAGAGMGRRGDRASVGARDSLAREAGASTRRLWGILAVESATTSLSLADTFLCAIDRPDLMQQLTVYDWVPNRFPWGWEKGAHSCGLGMRETGTDGPQAAKKPTAPQEGSCAGCGCHFDSATRGCRTCIGRKSKRKRYQEDPVYRVEHIRQRGERAKRARKLAKSGAGVDGRVDRGAGSLLPAASGPATSIEREAA